MSAVEAAAGKAQAMVRDSVKTVIAASMVGTAIEFYDFYAYGTAAANYFPKVFFGDTTNPTVALLASLLTFAIAFIARPRILGVRPFRRPHGPQDHAGGFAVDHGHRHVPDRLPADLQPVGHCGCRRAVPVPFRAGHRSGRRMVGCRFGGHRERSGRQARAVWLLPGIGRSDRFLPVERYLLPVGNVQR